MIDIKCLFISTLIILIFIQLNCYNHEKIRETYSPQKLSFNSAREKGLKELTSNNIVKSVAYLEYAVSKKPEFIDELQDLLETNRNIIYKEGFYYYKKENYDTAKKIFDFLIQIYPDWIELYEPASLINWYIFTSHKDFSLYSNQDIILKRISQKKYLLDRKITLEYYLTLSFFVTKYNTETVELLYGIFIDKKEYGKAEYILSKAAERGIYSFNSLMILGKTYIDNYQYKKADGIFRKIIINFKNNLKVKDLVLIGKTAISAEDYRLALSIFRDIVKNKPRNITAWRYLSKVYILMGDSISAFRCNKKIREIENPGY